MKTKVWTTLAFQEKFRRSRLSNRRRRRPENSHKEVKKKTSFWPRSTGLQEGMSFSHHSCASTNSDLSHRKVERPKWDRWRWWRVGASGPTKEESCSSRSLSSKEGQESLTIHKPQAFIISSIIPRHIKMRATKANPKIGDKEWVVSCTGNTENPTSFSSNSESTDDNPFSLLWKHALSTQLCPPLSSLHLDRFRMVSPREPLNDGHRFPLAFINDNPHWLAPRTQQVRPSTKVTPSQAWNNMQKLKDNKSSQGRISHELFEKQRREPLQEVEPPKI